MGPRSRSPLPFPGAPGAPRVACMYRCPSNRSWPRLSAVLWRTWTDRLHPSRARARQSTLFQPVWRRLVQIDIVIIPSPAICPSFKMLCCRVFAILAGVLCLQCGVSAGLRVLMVATVSSGSHYIWPNALTEGLLANGHQVVELTSKKPAEPHPNRTTFAIGKFLADESDLFNDLMNEMSEPSPWEDMKTITEFAIIGYQWTLNSQAFKDTVAYLKANRNKKFDVMIIDYPFQEVLIGLADLAGRPPIVAITAYLNPVHISQLMGNPLMPALVPHDSTVFKKNMSFTERLSNLLYYLMYEIGDYMYLKTPVELVYREHFGEAAPSLKQLTSEVALALVNSHPALHGSRPLVPSIVEVGLLQTRPGRPLPKDLQHWLDGAKNGFVFMSLGSVAKSASLKRDKRRSIIQAFAKIKQRVIWKYETDDIISELPSNVRVAKWLPQNDILAHPNIKVFVSHCGGLSSQELSYHGVPVLGIPLFADQFANGKKSEMLGLGKVLKFQDINEKTFADALNEVLNNPKYRENAKRLSAVLRDQKETPLERAVWWVEYVARTGGAPHLRSHALDLHWYQVHLLDVAAALAVLLASPLLLLWLLCRLCRRSAHSKSKTD